MINSIETSYLWRKAAQRLQDQNRRLQEDELRLRFLNVKMIANNRTMDHPRHRSERIRLLSEVIHVRKNIIAELSRVRIKVEQGPDMVWDVARHADRNYRSLSIQLRNTYQELLSL